MFQKFQVKEVVFIAILSSVLLLATAITVVAVMFSDIFALRQLLAAIPFGFFSVIAIRKVPKLGTLTLIGLITGIALLFILPVLFINQVVGAILAELFVLIFFCDYQSKAAIILAGGLYVPLTLPTTVLFNYWVQNQSIRSQVGSLPLGITVTIAVIVVSFLCASLGMRVSNELEKAGKL